MAILTEKILHMMSHTDQYSIFAKLDSALEYNTATLMQKYSDLVNIIKDEVVANESQTWELMGRVADAFDPIKNEIRECNVYLYYFILEYLDKYRRPNVNPYFSND